VSFLTDNRAYETSFKLFGPKGGIIGMAPANGRKFQANTQYSFQYCVNIGYQYKLRWKDNGNNGMVSQPLISLLAVICIFLDPETIRRSSVVNMEREPTAMESTVM